MIIKKTWSKSCGLGFKFYTGYFLFGFIPLYISIESKR